MFIHARIFETRWGSALVYLDNDDDYESEVLKIRVWAPLCDDGSLAICEMKVGLHEGSESACDAMQKANRSALVGMTAEGVEQAFARAQIADTLDDAFRQYPPTNRPLGERGTGS